jgi:hypothetical protein
MYTYVLAGVLVLVVIMVASPFVLVVRGFRFASLH